MLAPTATPSRPAFLNFGLHENREDEEKDCQTNQDHRNYAPRETARNQLAVNAHNHSPVQNVMQYKQSEENKCYHKMNHSPLMAIKPPEE
jgi:hypothetical protein